ncbi:FixH family protein [Kaistella antarctica]|uniref:FixH n=1 Tax=Kaistella antarctica TaxID=266748 RepID=A0A448NTV2_9FLAO|nr:FixH family protein [Kaistella antarctica]KEY18218.1 FixH protein [Kaistella antarctica]SEV83695.1 FixH protein [Kaistella antarctica]VEI00812.1 FixH [Kaistella antarctica]
MFKKFNWGHGVALALGLFIAFILFMVFGFTYGQQNSELVSDDYYGDELVYQEVIDAKNNADALAAIPKYQELKEGMKITFPGTIIPEDKHVKFELFRTDDANLDVKKEVDVDANNEILIPKQVISKGSYTLKIKWSQNKKPYQVDYDVLWK